MPHQKRLLILLALIIALCAVPALAQEEYSTVIIPPGEPILLGVALGLGPEGNIVLGTDALRGIQLAWEDQPDLQWGAASFALALAVQSTNCSSEGSAAVAENFVADSRIVGVLGPVCTASCLGAGPVYDDAGFSFISPGCTSSIFQQLAFSSFNHTLPVNNGQAVAGAYYLYETLGVTRVAMIYEDGGYGMSIAAALSEAFSALGGEIVSKTAIARGEEDYGPALAEAAAAEPEGIYLATYAPEATRIISQRAEAGLPELPIFGVSAWFSPAVAADAGAAAAGNVYLATNLPAEITEARADLQEAFLARYEERFGEAPVSHVHDNAYDAYVILRAAIEQVGTLDEEGNLHIDRADLAAAIRSYGPADGLSGPIACDGSGECVKSPIGIWQIQEGVFTLIEQMDDPSAMQP